MIRRIFEDFFRLGSRVAIIRWLRGEFGDGGAGGILLGIVAIIAVAAYLLWVFEESYDEAQTARRLSLGFGCVLWTGGALIFVAAVAWAWGYLFG